MHEQMILWERFCPVDSQQCGPWVVGYVRGCVLLEMLVTNLGAVLMVLLIHSEGRACLLGPRQPWRWSRFTLSASLIRRIVGKCLSLLLPCR